MTLLPRRVGSKLSCAFSLVRAVSLSMGLAPWWFTAALCAGGSHLAALWVLWQRRPSGDSGVDAVFDFGRLPTCPADCPAPSVGFCLGPFLDAAEELTEGLFAVVSGRFLELGVVFVFLVGFLVGRWSAPRPLRTDGPGPLPRAGARRRVGANRL